MPPSPPTTYILGTLPPPLGGVTVFVHRRAAVLRGAGQPCVVKDWNRMSRLGRLGWLLQILLDPRPARYEVNGFETQAMVALMLRPFRKEIDYWVHSGQFTARLHGFRRRLLTAFLRRIDTCVLVSPHIAGLFTENGFTVPAANRVQHAYLPPPLEEEAAIWATYDATTHAFAEQHAPLVVMQGADAFYQNVDRYGTDLAVEMMLLLRERFPRMGLLVGRPSVGSARFQAYCTALQRRLEAGGVASRVHFMTGERELWPLIKRADLFLRPSNQDGDSIAVREALLFGTPVVASDACPRPAGVVCFENRNAADLARQVADLAPALEPAAPTTHLGPVHG